MTGERTMPGGAALEGYWTPGSGGWDGDGGVDENWRKVGAGLASRLVVKSRTTDPLPSPGSLGDIYIVDAGDATNPNKIAVWDGPAGSEAWVYYPPFEGLPAYVTDEKRVSVYSGSAWVPTFATARVERATVFPIPDAALVGVPFDAVVLDEAGNYAGANPTRLTAVESGPHLLSGGIDTEVFNGASVFDLILALNGEGFPGRAALGERADSLNGSRFGNISTVLSLNAGDYVELKVFLNSGAARNLDATPANYLSMTRLG